MRPLWLFVLLIGAGLAVSDTLPQSVDAARKEFLETKTKADQGDASAH